MIDSQSPTTKQAGFARTSRERCAPAACDPRKLGCWVRDGAVNCSTANRAPRCVGCRGEIRYREWQPPGPTRIEAGRSKHDRASSGGGRA